MECRECEHLDINTIDRGAACKFGLQPETCGKFELAECFKAMVEKEARRGCQYGTYSDGDDRVFEVGNNTGKGEAGEQALST